MWWAIPFILQALVIGFDEGYFHLRRGLPRWERIGHPLDTLSVLICIAFVLVVPFSAVAVKWYAGLAIFSCIFVTKDEFVHKEHCPASEQWLHAILFTLHPIILFIVGCMWPVSQGVVAPDWIIRWFGPAEVMQLILMGQFAAMTLFSLYQVIYWNFLCQENQKKK